MINLIESFEARRLLSVGALDPTFGTNGIAATPIAETSTNAIVSTDSMGRIYVGGSDPSSFEKPASATVVRLKPDGALDTTFANHGSFHVVATDSDLDSAEPSQIAVAPDGRIAVGWMNDDPNDFDPSDAAPVVKMFHADGSVDQSFGTKGVMKFVLPPDANQFSMPIQSIVKVAFDSSNRLIVAAMERADLLLYRFKANGAIDTSFGSHGLTRFSGVGFDDSNVGIEFNVKVHKLLLQPDGEIYLAAGAHSTGSFEDPDIGDVNEFSVAQGIIAHLDANGHTIVTFSDDFDDPDDFQILSDGSMLSVLQGYTSTEDQEGDLIFHIESHLSGIDAQGNLTDLNGQDDFRPSFLQQGVFIYGITQMTDGRYALSIELGSENFGMAVLKSDLSLDTGFGDDGVLAFPAKIGLASRPQILGNGKLLFADAGNAFEVDPNAAGATILPIRLGVDGELIIQGTHLNDQINVEHIGQDFRVILNGKETDFAADQVNFVTIDAAKGNDFVRLQGNAPHSLVLGGPGDDTIFGGKGSDNLSGGDGNDSLRGGGGSDQISGNGGNDIIRGDDGADSITGGGGNDRLFGNDGSDHINGGKGNDRIYGGNNDDAISGGDGNDTILADAGNDHLNGGNGADFLNGGDGQDFAQIDKADRKIINVEGSSYF